MNYATSKDGTKIAYDTYGNGPALIFITGATCFRNFAPVLQDAKTYAQSFTVYNYDRRGRGDSQDNPHYNIEKEVEDIAALIDEAGGSAYLYGHSSGAILALEAAMRLNDSQIQGVAIYDASYAHSEEYLAEFKELASKLQTLIEQEKCSDALETFLLNIGTPKQIVEYMKSSPDWSTMERLAPTLRYDVELAGTLPPVDRIAHITLPVHIMIGQESPSTIHETASQLRKALPRAPYTELADQDHMPSPEAVLEVLKQTIK